jgi:hypothetical protein
MIKVRTFGTKIDVEEVKNSQDKNTLMEFDVNGILFSIEKKGKRAIVHSFEDEILLATISFSPNPLKEEKTIVIETTDTTAILVKNVNY